MKKIINLTAIATAILLPNLVQAQATSPMEISATVEPGCFLSAENINFGNLITPITNQSAQGKITLTCSKNTQLSLAVRYGNISSSANTSGNITYVSIQETNTSQNIKIYRNGVPISNVFYDIRCYPGWEPRFYSSQAAILFGYDWLGDDIRTPTKPGITPVCTDVSSSKSIFNTASISNLNQVFGSLTGLINAEKIVYSISHPTNSTPLSENNKYSLIATGIEQTVVMKANITSAGNPTYRMTPDTYQDTLTVVLTY